MAGFPYHQLESYLGKLIAAGFAPPSATGRRPQAGQGAGQPRSDAHRHARHRHRRRPARSPREQLSGGRRRRAIRSAWPGSSCRPAGSWRPHFPAAQLTDQLARIAPAECLLAEDAPPLARHLDEQMLVTRRPGWAFSLETARQALLKHFGTTNLEGFGFSTSRATTRPLRAAGAVLDYLNETQKTSLEHIDRLVRLSQCDGRWRSTSRAAAAWRSRARSATAAARARCWPCSIAPSPRWARGCWPNGWPIRSSTSPRSTRGSTPWPSWWLDAALADHLRETLRQVYDLERLLARVTTGRASPRDLSFLGRTLRALPALKAKLDGPQERPLEPNWKRRSIFVPTCAAGSTRRWPTTARSSSRDGGFIRDGFHAPSWTTCASWPPAASSGSPATRPRRASGPASPP